MNWINRRHLIILFLICFLGLTGWAQDVHFTQFYLSPLTTNPALTGNTEGDWRLSANHRNQWSSIGRPFRTTSLGFEHNFYPFNEKFSGGILYLHDGSGDVNLTYDKIMLSGAYHKRFGQHVFKFGVQPGMVFKRIDLNGVSLPDQYDRNTGGFNSDLPTGERKINESINYFDFNAGVAYSLRLEKLILKGGYAMFHINQPAESFYNTKNVLPTRHLFHGGAEFKFNDIWVLYPHTMYMNHQKASELLLGLNLMMQLEDNKAKATGIYAGLMVRNGINRNTDAAVAILGMKFKKLEVGVNYDFNVSELRSATKAQGAYEFSIIYTGASSTLKKTAVPCDRF
jgi:type IX secretion system PorP/SprF family membrane protein